MTDSRPVIAFLRFRAGVVSESKRAAHIVPHPGDDLSTLVALCGQVFEDPDEVELLNPFEGMPCNPCVLLSRIPDPDDELPAGDNSPPSLLLCGRTNGVIHTYTGTKSVSRPLRKFAHRISIGLAAVTALLSLAAATPASGRRPPCPQCRRRFAT